MSDDRPTEDTVDGDASDEGASDEEPIRESTAHAASGAPNAGWAIGDRYSSEEIFQRVLATADEEVSTGTRELLFSGLAAGFAIVLTFVGHAAATAYFPDNPFIGSLLYPIGFVYIILGRYQLYTENTLPPVALVLARLASLPLMVRIWVIVLVGNVVGAGLGVFVLANTHVLSPAAMAAGADFTKTGLDATWWDVFFKAVFAGWLVAGVVWLSHAVRDSIARLVLIYVVFYTIAATELYHVVTTAADALFFVFVNGTDVFTVFAEFWLPVLLGNTVGGVVLVALVNYGQTERRRFPEVRELSTREWLFGWEGGRERAPVDVEEAGPRDD